MEKDYLIDIFKNALIKLGVEDTNILSFETPNNPEFGDVATNIAMQLARSLKKNPRQIADDIISNLEYNQDVIDNVNVAGAGFINIKFTPVFYDILFEKIRQFGKDYGKQKVGEGVKVNVEYVSANPTGLLHLGHGRNAVVGDTVANLFEWMGYDVTREYYFNNAGNQMNNLGKSIYARYMQIEEPEFPFPEDGYHGEYIKLIAENLYSSNPNKYKNIESNSELFIEIRKAGEEWCFDKIKQTLETLKIKQEVFFNEDSLYKESKIDEVLTTLKNKGLSYEKDDAIWLKLSEMGLEQDRVIVKSSGEPTYRLPDIAYHIEKFKRGFDILVDVFGADHIATIPDVMQTLEHLGYDKNKISVLIHQFVTLTENGKQVKMSKRTGKSYTLDDLLEEVGADVVRFFFIMRSISTHLEFDLGLAKEQSEKNPVFYLQYAHARACSIFEKAKEQNITLNNEYNYKLLTDEAEINLIKQLIRFPEIIEISCNKRESHILAEYLKEVASTFHKFFHNCRILDSEQEIRDARLQLANTTRTVIKNGLSILGINAPEKM
jgi:arginyl-tRNA synthetase